MSQLKLAVLLVGLLLVTLPVDVQGRMGFDISAFHGPVDCFDEIVAAGHSFMIIELQSAHVWNNDLIHNINGARKAGINDIDVYLFPQKNRTAREQVTSAITFLQTNQIEYGTFWFDVENQTYWFDTCDENIEFLKEMLAVALEFLPPERVGIYVEYYFWKPLMCLSELFSGFKLWWPRFDGSTSMDTFKPFGGWNKPVMKQYLPDQIVACAKVDIDWKP